VLTEARTELRVLALLEASSISGTAKAVLEMAYEAQANMGIGPVMGISIANFARGEGPVQNALTDAAKGAQIPLSFIREKGRFDTSVIGQIRDLAEPADLVWTNSVKSHFLVRRARVESKWVAFHHGYTSTDIKMRLYNQLDRFSLRHADLVLTVCRPFAGQMTERGVAASRIRVQHMPIRRFAVSAADSEALKMELRLVPEARVILTVGRLSREKGHKDLIRAFARLRDNRAGDGLRLVIVGDGPERSSLEQLARECDVREQVVFAGHRDDAKRFYGMADVFALPSYTEGTPNVLLEAMAARLPVVSTNVGGIPEMATDGENALLVPATDPESLAEALQRVLQSADLRGELVANAESVVDAHSPQLYFEGMRKVFLEAAGG
jgi:glycosyltransferase involved in cell wall biosynthesis